MAAWAELLKAIGAVLLAFFAFVALWVFKGEIKNLLKNFRRGNRCRSVVEIAEARVSIRSVRLYVDTVSVSHVDSAELAFKAIPAPELKSQFDELWHLGLHEQPSSILRARV